ncbi:Ropporin-1-like protein [Borealophlyctis nickersoniae]|nr:Ropporin-1-like protein [Borealophlyctis nickersoniae]
MTEITHAETDGPLYTSEQIRIPPDLPDILKNYTKHIIRTQPADILASSAEYVLLWYTEKDMNILQFFATDKPTVTRKDIDEACGHCGIGGGIVTEIVS